MSPVTPSLCCPRCKNTIGQEQTQRVNCGQCGLAIELGGQGIAYNYTELLQAADPVHYLLYRTLCNNGFVSYHELAAGSLSIATRPDVAKFGQFLDSKIPPNSWVLDIGCGPLATPGYLLPLQSKQTQFVGLDVYSTTFSGFRIQGCAEFLPLIDSSFDAVIFATSLDHVFNLSRALRESRRVLKPGGDCLIWMSDRKPYWQQFLFSRPGGEPLLRRVFLDLPRRILSNFRHRRRPLYGISHWFERSRYWRYENGQVFYCPPGAIDPFHAWFESPAKICAIAKKEGFSSALVAGSENGAFVQLKN